MESYEATAMIQAGDDIGLDSGGSKRLNPPTMRSCWTPSVYVAGIILGGGDIGKSQANRIFALVQITFSKKKKK